MKPKYHDRYDPNTDHNPDRHQHNKRLRDIRDRDECEEEVDLRRMIAMERDYEMSRYGGPHHD